MLAPKILHLSCSCGLKQGGARTKTAAAAAPGSSSCVLITSILCCIWSSRSYSCRWSANITPEHITGKQVKGKSHTRCAAAAGECNALWPDTSLKSSGCTMDRSHHRTAGGACILPQPGMQPGKYSDQLMRLCHARASLLKCMRTFSPLFSGPVS